MGTQQDFREVSITRDTSETNITLRINLDGNGKVTVDTGFGMADHMITLMAFWADFDLDLQCKGDIDVDAHHTLEDIALVMGQAIKQALGEKKDIARTASAKVPMDEALAEACIDLSGRPYHVMRGQELLPPVIAGEENDLWREFFKSLAAGAGMNLHIEFHYGKNGHHLLESAFKSLGLALRSAIQHERSTLLSTKGSFD